MFDSYKIRDKKTLLTVFIVVISILSFIGILTQFSLSVPESLKNSNGTNFYSIPSKHLFFTFVGFAFIVVTIMVPFDWLDILFRNDIIPVGFFSFTVFTLIYVLIFGKEINGARRWIDLKVFNFQPSEFAKIFVILLVAILIQISSVKRKLKNRVNIYFIGLFIVVVLCLLIYKSRALSSALQIMLIFLSMYAFYDGISYVYVLGTGVLGLVGGAYAILGTSYRSARIGLTEQALLSVRSIARGGVRGAGYQEGLARSFYLPEVQTDYAFAGFTEEWGTVGFIFLLILLLTLVLILFYASNFTRILYERMVLIGSAIMILNQVILHIGINLSILPSTGVTLPFISYGGTSTLVLYAILGICISIIVKFDDYLEVK